MAFAGLGGHMNDRIKATSCNCAAYGARQMQPMLAMLMGVSGI
jgi:hypothetical protein